MYQAVENGTARGAQVEGYAIGVRQVLQRNSLGIKKTI